MKIVRRYQTSDGVLHVDGERALSHAEHRYGDALAALAHRLVRIDKYLSMTEFLSDPANLADIVALDALKADCHMQVCEDDDDEDNDTE